MASKLYKGLDPLATTAPPVVNNLTSTSTTSALSAYQGKVLNDKVKSLFVKDSLEIPAFTVNAGTYVDKTATIPTKAGYTPVAVSEWMLRTATGTLTRATINASNMELTITVGNPTQTAITPNPYFNILYIKDIS